MFCSSSCKFLTSPLPTHLSSCLAICTWQDIPIGHVEKCTHELAVLLGGAPADASLRASLRALLIAETLRGGASSEVASYVRRLASLIANAASRARPLPAPVTPSPRQQSSSTTTATAFGAAPAAATGQGQGEFLSISCTDDVDDVESSANADGEEVQAHAEGAKAGGAAGEGGAGANACAVARGLVEYNDATSLRSPPVITLIQDPEGAAAYAHALVHVARSKKRQREAAARVAAGEVRGATRIEALWKGEEDAPAAPTDLVPQTAGASAVDPTITKTINVNVPTGTMKHATGSRLMARTEVRCSATPLQDWGQSEPLPSVVPSPAAPNVENTGTPSPPPLAPPKVVGSIPGVLPFSSSGEALLLHAKAMVGLKRTQRWAQAWLALPEGSSAVGWSFSPPLAAAVIEIMGENKKITATAAAPGSPHLLDLVCTSGQPKAVEETEMEEGQEEHQLAQGGASASGATDSSSRGTGNGTTSSTPSQGEVDKTSEEYLAGFAAAIAEPKERPFEGRFAWGIHAAGECTPPLWAPNASTLAALGLKVPRNLALHPPQPSLALAPPAGVQHAPAGEETTRHAAAATAEAAAHHAAAHHAAHHAAAHHAAAVAAAAAASGSVPFGMMNPFWAQASAAAAAAAAATVNAQLQQRSYRSTPILTYGAGAGGSSRVVAAPLAAGAPRSVTTLANPVVPMANAPVALAVSATPVAVAVAAGSTPILTAPLPAPITVSVGSTINPTPAVAAAPAGVGMDMPADNSSPTAAVASPLPL